MRSVLSYTAGCHGNHCTLHRSVVAVLCLRQLRQCAQRSSPDVGARVVQQPYQHSPVPSFERARNTSLCQKYSDAPFHDRVCLLVHRSIAQRLCVCARVWVWVSEGKGEGAERGLGLQRR